MIIQKGDSGKKVIELQTLLNKNGFSLTVDGDFGKKTLEAVTAFQKSKGLFVDGVVGNNTLSVLKQDKRALKAEDYKRAAQELNIEEAAVRAVTEVESNGRGFKLDGRIKILFEGHQFYKRIDNPELKMNKDTADIIYPKWVKTYYKGDQYDRLERAKQIDEIAALKSTSWGMFQIMGFNYKLCGFTNVKDFVEFNKKDEGNQLLCFVRFCAAQNLDDHLRNLDFEKFARGYNGSGYKKNNYHTKLKDAYKRYAS